MSNTSSRNLVGRTLHRYRILELSREDAMGPVWIAEDLLLRRRVAIQTLRPDFAESAEERAAFLRDAQATSTLSHSGIARTYDAGMAEGQSFVAFELIEGQTVEERLRQGPLSWQKAVRLVREVAQALAYAHGQGAFHGDVTSRKVVERCNGSAVLVGFGLSRARNRTDTPGQAAARTDVHGLGVVLHEMLTGSCPGDGAASEPPSATTSGIPGVLDQIVLKALGETPQSYERADELAADLLQLESTETPAVVHATLRSSRWPGRPWMVTAALLALAVASVVFVRPFVAPRATQYDSVAVLPFRDESVDVADSELWVLGISETIATKLAKLDGLRVSPWVTSQMYSLAAAPPSAICEELNVDAIVAGTCRIFRDGVYVSVTLLERDGTDVWQARFEEPLERILGVQGDIAMSVAKRLGGTLSGDEALEFRRDVAQSVEAYRLFLQGSAKLHEVGSSSNLEALTLFRRTIDLDPSLAAAHVGIGAAYVDRYQFGWKGGAESLDLARDSFTRALEMDPENTRATRGLVRVAFYQGARLELLERARSLFDRDGRTVDDLLLQAEAYDMGGLPSESIPILQTIIGLDPMNRAAHYFLVITSVRSGRFQAAVDAGEDYLRKFSEEPTVLTRMGEAYQELGQLELARAHFERVRAASPEQATWVALGGLLMELGEEDEARGVLLEGVEAAHRYLAAFPDHTWSIADLIWSYALLGDRESFEDVVDRSTALGPLSASRALAVSHAWLGEYEIARSFLERAMDEGMYWEPPFYAKTLGYGFRDLLARPENADLRERYRANIARMKNEYGAASRGLSTETGSPLGE